MDSQYKDFIESNGHVYPQRADSLKTYPGYNKLRMKWLKPKSPRVIYSMVYWNNYQDSMKVELKSFTDTITVDILNLNEYTYTFYIKNYDVEGNVSIPTEAVGTPYGENYLVTVNDRTYSSATRSSTNEGNINWGPVTNDLIYTEIKYQNLAGKISTIKVNADDNFTNIPNIKPGVKFEYRSVFLPIKGIDTIKRDWKESDMPFMYMFPRSSWTAVAKGGNHEWGDGGGGQPNLIFDGDLNTGWHSRVGEELPQCVVIDMKSINTIDNIILYPPSTTNWRYIKDVEIYISNNEMDPNIPDIPTSTWGEPVAEVQYTGDDSLKINFSKSFTGRYIAVIFKNTSNSNKNISFMEFEAYSM